MERRGHRGPRGPRHERDPLKSLFWVKYISKGLSATADDPNSIWEETPHDEKQFRNQFSIPYVIYDKIFKDWEATGKY